MTADRRHESIVPTALLLAVISADGRSTRADFARTERSALAPAARPSQELIDALFFGMTGLSEAEVKALEEGYEKML